MIKVYTLFLGLVFSLTGISQSCLPEGIEFTSQAQIDSFQVNYPNWTQIEGDVTINGNDINNLNGLSLLSSIMGSLTIGAFPESNNSLNSLTGLDGLTYVGGNLKIVYNNILESLTGLANLDTIGSGLWVLCNDSLTSLIGMQGLTSLGGDLDIEQNNCLSSLTGLENVDSIGGMIRIQDNLSLTNFIGLSGLITIGGHLQIFDNDSLVSLTGLENLTSIQGNIWISFNNILTSLIALDNINAGSIINLLIGDNISLSTCDARSICSYLASPNGEIIIFGNATGCNSQEELEEACKAGLNDNSPQPQITIHPNPSTTAITLTLPTNVRVDNTTLSIYNVNVQQFISQPITEHQTVVDISKLPPGVYFVRVFNDRTLLVAWFIKQ